ncbi:MAG: AsnC family transcriptional regulator [Desulfurococcales archaeon ex4484_217_1]|nr:MAG: AsnC family transcriptional regulator [Desulfurococcales archaeon ex4484_217_1]
MSLIDDIDREIIEVLKRNSRTPYTTIAKKLGLSEAAVRKRVSKLLKQGVIKRFTIEYALQNEIKAVVLVKTSPQVPVFKISKEIANLQGVDHVYEITGEHDVLAVIRADNVLALDSIINSIRNIDGVSDTNTMIILNIRL